MTQGQTSLVGRVAVFLEREQGRSLEEAHELAEKLLYQLGLDVRTDLGAFLAQGAPVDEQHRRLAYWTEEQYWDAIDPKARHILQAVKATREEIEVLTMG